MLQEDRGQGGGGKDVPIGMTVVGGRRQCIWQVVLHRLQIVTSYPGHFVSGPSAVTEMEVQRKKLIRVQDIQEVHLANHNRSNSASHDGLSGVFQFLLQFTHGKVFRHLRHPWAVVFSLVEVQTL